VLLVTEMIHDARIVRLEPSVARETRSMPAGPPKRSWFGDSVGRWEGETLVVETGDFDERWVFRGSGPDLRLVERFTRVNAETIDYRVTLHDPATWARSWTMTFPMTARPGAKEERLSPTPRVQ
jgi:hypothetical protein